MSNTISPISNILKTLRSFTQVNVQNQWQYSHDSSPLLVDWINWKIAELNSKEHIAWESGKELWLVQEWLIPDNLHGYSLKGLNLRLKLIWWAAQAEIYLNGDLVQQGDLFDCSPRVLLSSNIKAGERIQIILRLVSPSHDRGALVCSQLIYEAKNKHFDPGYIADELDICQNYLKLFESETLPKLESLILDTQDKDLSNPKIYQTLLPQIQSIVSYATNQIYLLGHAHLDLAWLWDIEETWVSAKRTFESVLNLQQQFPNLTFCHSTPALYDWVEHHCPNLFTAIQKQVKKGRWEVVGGMWVEPEFNLISGESIVRQLLYGQRYTQAKFGEISTVAWLPDSFGFCWQLPQFLKQAGINYFVTQKLRWNDTTEFPYGVFLWQSPDGSQIFSLMSAPIGEGIEPVKMANYANQWKVQTGLKSSLWIPGVGDHGGGPTRDMLEIQQRWQSSLFLPEMEFTTAKTYLRKIEQEAGEIPVWKDELYLEFHRGCYTTHADQKRFNRHSERLLYEAELFASMATISTGASYPKVELEAAWKKVLFNQFHDILPGTSIPSVFVEANQAWQEVGQVGKEILQGALQAIATRISLPTPPHPTAQPIFVFNSLNWKRSHVVSLPLPPNSGQSCYICDHLGQKLPSQLTKKDLLFLAKDIPSIGYRLFWLCWEAEKLDLPLSSQEEDLKCLQLTHHKESISQKKSTNTISQKDWVLENELLQVKIDSETGDLASIYDKTNQREVLNSKGGNILQSFQDKGQYWDAWNIDPNYADYPLPATQLISISWLEQGQLQQSIRVVRCLGKSTFQQDYILNTNSNLLKIETTVDWQERQVLVKAAFNFNLETDSATYEIPCGAIVHPTRPQELKDKAKWEIPAQHWADLTTEEYGVSLLNDCKYGYDAHPSQLRLTLLRSSSWPDPIADRGEHQFTYAIYPHQGNWKVGETVKRGYELNSPLQVVIGNKNSNNCTLPTTGSFLDLQANNLVLMAFKQAEDEPNAWILRCYESQGESAKLSLKSDLKLEIETSTNLLEQIKSSQLEEISAWKIVTLRVIRQLD